MQTESKIPQVQLNLLDRLVMWTAPTWGANRIRSRGALTFWNNHGYVVAGSNKKSMQAWNPSANTPDADIIPKLGAMRAGARDMFMNSPIVKGILRRAKTNVIGSGLALQSRIDRDFLGLKDDQANTWEANTEREFNLWAESVECDASRHQNFYDLTALTYLSVLMSGDVFVAFPFIPRKGQPYDLRIKLMEADFVSNPLFQMDTKKIAGGIEVDSDGAPEFYHFRKATQDNILDLGPSASDTWVKVAVYNTSGMRQVLHIFDKERPGQRRGVPFVAPIIEILKGLSRFADAEIKAAVINSMFTVFIKHQSEQGSLDDGHIPPTDGLPLGAPGVESIPENDPRKDKSYELNSGNVIDLDLNEEIQLADPKHPNTAFDGFLNSVIKQIGAALEIPQEVILLNFNSSYSAARAAMNEAWKFFIERRVFMARYFCNPVFEWWMTEAVLQGRISAPGFFEDPAVKKAWLGSEWVGPGRGMIDPIKEIKAAREAIAGRLSTYEAEFIKLHGRDWLKSMNRLSREEQHLKDKGLFIPEPAATAAQAVESTSIENTPTNEPGTE